MSGKQNRIMGIMGTDSNFPNHWKNFFQSLEKYGNFFPIVGKFEKIFSNRWKIRVIFSNHWKVFFQSLENGLQEGER